MTKKPNELHVNPLPLERFSWNAQSRTLVAEGSDFGPLRETFDPRTGRTWIQQLWNDACDVGIAIESHKTGKVERFYLSQEETHDGDLLAWHFKPVSKSCPVNEVVILND